MWRAQRVALLVTVLTMSGSLHAQQTGLPQGVTQRADGFVFDIRQASLATVLNAIAEAGRLNLAIGNLTSPVLINFQTSEPIRERADFIAAIRKTAERNGLQFNETSSLLRVSEMPAMTVDALALEQQAMLAAKQALAVGAGGQTLHVVQLHHVSADVLVTVLTALFQQQAAGSATSTGQQGSADAAGRDGRAAAGATAVGASVGQSATVGAAAASATVRQGGGGGN